MIYAEIRVFLFSIPIAYSFGIWMDSFTSGCFMLNLCIFINILWFAKK